MQLGRLEDRRMLAATADILFLVDESASDLSTNTQDWLEAIFANLAAGLQADQIDARYGLIGLGEGLSPQGNTARFGHSQLLGPTGNKEYWTANDTEVASAINNELAKLGGGASEDGWDAIEYAIAEYGFREGAVPIVVLVQGDQGRSTLNETLTRTGILETLRSKNVIFNTITAGELLQDGETITAPRVLELVNEGIRFADAGNIPLIPQPVASWAPLFNLAPYGLDEDYYVLGVESDSADWNSDGRHDYHVFDTVNNQIPGSLTSTESEALQVSYLGSNTGATGMVGSGKSLLIGQNVIGGLGPTTDGYSAKSVPFAVVDMTGAIEHTNLANSISYSFPFYGTTETAMWVNEDGTISFDGALNASDAGKNVDLSQTVSGQDRPSNPLIAVLWDDLFEPFSPDGKVLVKTTDVDGDSASDLVIEWRDYVHLGDIGPYDPVSFQAILYANGSIQFNYVDLDTYPNNNAESTIEDTGGIGATVGIWGGSVDPLTVAAGKFVPGPHSIQTDSSGETSDSYIRMAWDTGGAAWDVGLVDRFGPTSPEANALRGAFIDSLIGQIDRAELLGKVYHEDDVLTPVLELNVGSSSASGDYVADTLYAPAGTTTVSTVNSIGFHLTNSIPDNARPWSFSRLAKGT